MTRVYDVENCIFVTTLIYATQIEHDANILKLTLKKVVYILQFNNFKLVLISQNYSQHNNTNEE